MTGTFTENTFILKRIVPRKFAEVKLQRVLTWCKVAQFCCKMFLPRQTPQIWRKDPPILFCRCPFTFEVPFQREREKESERERDAFISTHLNYFNTLWYRGTQASLSYLQLVQNAVAKLLTHKWLPVQFRIDVKILWFVFRALHGLTASYITDLLKLHAPSRSLRSTDQVLLVPP